MPPKIGGDHFKKFNSYARTSGSVDNFPHHSQVVNMSHDLGDSNNTITFLRDNTNCLQATRTYSANGKQRELQKRDVELGRLRVTRTVHETFVKPFFKELNVTCISDAIYKLAQQSQAQRTSQTTQPQAKVTAPEWSFQQDKDLLASQLTK